MHSIGAQKAKYPYRPKRLLASPPEYFDITISGGSSSNTASLNWKVDPDRSFIVPNGVRATAGSSTALNDVNAYGQLTAAGTVTATRGTSTSGVDIHVCGTVIHGTPEFIVRVQRGTILLGSGQTSNTASISQVDFGASIAIWQGQSGGPTGNNYNSGFADVDLTNSTTVTATRNTSGNTLTVAFVVITFTPKVAKAIQKVANTSTAGVTSETSTLSPTLETISENITFTGGQSTGSTSSQNALWRAELTNTSTVTFTRTSTSGTTRTRRLTLVALQRYIFKSIQRGTIAMGASASATASVSRVEPNQSVVAWLHQSTADGTGVFQNFYCTVKLTDPTTVTADRGTGSSNSTVVSYELWEFW